MSSDKLAIYDTFIGECMDEGEEFIGGYASDIYGKSAKWYYSENKRMPV